MSFLFLCQILITVDGSIQLGQIRSAAYIPNNLTNVTLYNGTCSQCICYAFISNRSSIYQALNCFTNNNTCQLFRDVLSRSFIRIDTNTTLFLRSLPTNTTQSSVFFYQYCCLIISIDEKSCREKNLLLFITYTYSDCQFFFRREVKNVSKWHSTSLSSIVLDNILFIHICFIEDIQWLLFSRRLCCWLRSMWWFFMEWNN